MTDWGLSNKAFWDVDLNELDFEKHARFVIAKVFNDGTWEDQIAVMNYYGPDRLKKEVLFIPYLRLNVVTYLCLLLDLKKEDFLCCKPKQLPQLHWDY